MIRVPQYAKQAAKKALEKRASLPDSKKFGLSEKEAKKKGIMSGVLRAKQLIRKEEISERDAQNIVNFYNRFKGCRTSKCEGAINLWGGRKFAKSLENRLK